MHLTVRCACARMLFSVLSVCCARSRPFLNRGRPLQPRSVRAPRAFPALFYRRGQPLHPRSVRAPRVPGPFQSSRATASTSSCPCTARSRPFSIVAGDRFVLVLSVRRVRSRPRRLGARSADRPYLQTTMYISKRFAVPAARMRPSRIVTGFSGRCLLVPILRRASVSDFSRFRRRPSRGFPGSAMRIKGRYRGFVCSNYDVMYLHSNPRFLL